MDPTAFFQLPPAEQGARLQALARRALEAWGVHGVEPRLIKFRENAVFEVRDRAGRPAALRVHRQGYHSNESLQSELRWMAMLADGGLIVPQPVPTRAGELLLEQRSPEAPGVWQVDMLSWLDGRQLGNVGEPLTLPADRIAPVFTELGRTMGRLHELSAAWPGQASAVRHAWDAQGLAGDQPFWGRFWELAALNDAQRRLTLQAKAALLDDLQAYGRMPQNYGLIHADLVSENVLLSGPQVQLIDFDDAGFGWHGFEIVTALYWLADEPAFDAIERAVLDGYRQVHPFGERDMALLPALRAARSLTYLGWVHTRQHTEAAVELTPLMIEFAERHCSHYLSQGRLR